MKHTYLVQLLAAISSLHNETKMYKCTYNCSASTLILMKLQYCCDVFYVLMRDVRQFCCGFMDNYFYLPKLVALFITQTLHSSSILCCLINNCNWIFPPTLMTICKTKWQVGPSLMESFCWYLHYISHLIFGACLVYIWQKICWKNCT